MLTAGYLLWMLQRVNLGEVPEEWRDKPFHDADRFELAAGVPLVLATLAIGVYPALVFGATNDSVVRLLAARLRRLSELFHYHALLPEDHPRRHPAGGARGGPRGGPAAPLARRGGRDRGPAGRRRAPADPGRPQAGGTREMFGGSYVVDDFALVLKGLFLVAGAIVLLASVSYLRRGPLLRGGVLLPGPRLDRSGR